MNYETRELRENARLGTPAPCPKLPASSYRSGNLSFEKRRKESCNGTQAKLFFST